MMPGKTGLEFTQWKIKVKLTLQLYCWLQKERQVKELKALEVGADDYLGKTFEPKELILRIKNILNKTKLKNHKKSYWIWKY